MLANWRKSSLSAAGITLIDCDHRTPPDAGYGHPYVAIPQLRDGRLDLSSVRRITREHWLEWTRKAKPQADDVLLSRRCNPGETAVVPHGIEFAVGQNLVLLRSDGRIVFPPFLRWLVRGPEWWEQVSRHLNVGAVFDSLKCADIPCFQVTLPPLPEQRAIAAVLGALDDKIDLNRRLCATLEETARALFKSWFVDFDPVRAKAEGRPPFGMDAATAALFPDEFEDSELGEVPRGWAVQSLANLTSKIGSGATPRGGEKAYVASGVAFIRSQNVYDSNFVWDGLVRLKNADAEQLRTVTVQRGDVLLNITGASFLRTCIVDPDVLPARVNQHVAIVRADEGVPPQFVHKLLLLTRVRHFLAGMDAGASRQAITKGHIESVKTVVPPSQLLRVFSATTDPLLARKDSAVRENRVLANLRDYLLPKLLSGGVRVRDAEKAVEA